MGKYTMFENPRRGMQARNFNSKCSENSRSQIVFRTDIFKKLSLGAPEVSPGQQTKSVNEDTVTWLFKQTPKVNRTNTTGGNGANPTMI